MPSVDELMRIYAQDQEAIANLQLRLSHATSYVERNSALRRIRKLEDHLNGIYQQYLRAISGKAKPVTVFGTTKKPRTRAGISVTMDISIDGQYFSNPAPRITNGLRIWVRLRMDMAQKSPFSTAKTDIPSFIRCRWVIPRGYTPLDKYARVGRVEHVVSLPQTVTREFQSPSSGSTRANFGCYVDPYFQREAAAPLIPDTSPVELTTVLAIFEPGTYRFYVLTANVLDSYETDTFGEAGTQMLVDESDVPIFYTDGNTTLLARQVLSGDRAGYWFVIDQPGVSLEEYTGSV